MDTKKFWICCQLGAREHYSIPRSLHEAGHLSCLVTDAWLAPGSLFAKVPHKRFQERFHAGLASARVFSWNLEILGIHLFSKGMRDDRWRTTLSHNRWFQSKTVSALKEMQESLRNCDVTVFSYSYTALAPFQFAKSLGWRTVLGQIDPGLAEEKIVRKLHQDSKLVSTEWGPAPPGYWSAWKQECLLADEIVVNSDWSREALIGEGVDASKLTVLPLAYEASESEEPATHQYPEVFSDQRKLRVLFLGQANLRKGIEPLLDAASRLADHPIEFLIAGPVQIEASAAPGTKRNIKFLGIVPRSEVRILYRLADVFLFPTFSDGFGLTQLEAQAESLPIIVSRNCGNVIEDQVNGLVLNEVTSEEIERKLLICLRHPFLLRQLSSSSSVSPNFSLRSLKNGLLSL